MISHVLLAASLLFVPTPPSDVIELPREIEIELARSALPAHLRSGATVYVYDPSHGFEVAHEGTNGFHALVGRDDPAIRWAVFDFEEYPRDFLIPVAFDEAGHEAQLKAYLDLGTWRAQGVPAGEAQRRLRRGFERGEYATPPRTGVGYMLAPIVRSYVRTEVDPTVRTFVFPHYMFYAPNVTDEDIGSGAGIVMRPSMPDPHGMIVVLAGEAERARYRTEADGLLARLCALHEPWCVS